MEKLKEIRKRKKYTQQDLATYLKISQTDYCYMEKGEKEIQDEQWMKLSQFLDVEIDDIKENFNPKSQYHNFENVSDCNYVGSNNIYCSIPEFVLENQKEYIQLLKNEIESLKGKLLINENK